MNCLKYPKTFCMVICEKKTNKTGDASTLDDNLGQLITSEIITAKLLNNYVSSVFVMDADINFKQNVDPSNTGAIDNIDINRHMIVEALDKLNISKSSGPEGPRIIKECKESFTNVCHVILKKSLKEGLLPKQDKKGK